MIQRYIFFILSLMAISCGNNTVLQEVKKLDHYPSASAIEYTNNTVYVLGDDANQLLLLDSALVIKDSIELYSYPEKRIPKDIKPDLEALTFIKRRKYLFAVGSGSLIPQRNIGWLIDPLTKQKDSIRLDTFYRRLSLNGIIEVNIEGITAVPNAIILSNRGNKSYPKNHLVFTRENFYEQQSHTNITIALIGFNTDSASFKGVSGLGYSYRNDKLFLTVSTENTRNNLEDGTIGKSYLWIVKSISSKTRWKAINPDQIIDLEKTDPRFKGQKIESVCVMKETRKFIYLLLAADNDDGSSTLFKLAVPNN